MPIVAHSQLPTFMTLREQGQTVLSLDRAVHQDTRELHVGLLDMMPDAALRVTERVPAAPTFVPRTPQASLPG